MNISKPSPTATLPPTHTAECETLRALSLQRACREPAASSQGWPAPPHTPLCPRRPTQRGQCPSPGRRARWKWRLRIEGLAGAPGQGLLSEITLVEMAPPAALLTAGPHQPTRGALVKELRQGRAGFICHPCQSSQNSLSQLPLRTGTPLHPPPTIVTSSAWQHGEDLSVLYPGSAVAETLHVVCQVWLDVWVVGEGKGMHN